MFTTPIIYKPATEADRQEFIKHLEDVGYIVIQKWLEAEYIETHAHHAAITFDCIVMPNVYDCGSNLQLAKALSALRDDSYYMQWFVIHAPCYPNDYIGKMVFNHVGPVNANYVCKATKEELIKHFKIEQNGNKNLY